MLDYKYIINLWIFSQLFDATSAGTENEMIFSIMDLRSKNDIQIVSLEEFWEGNISPFCGHVLMKWNGQIIRLAGLGGRRC